MSTKEELEGFNEVGYMANQSEDRPKRISKIVLEKYFISYLEHWGDLSRLSQAEFVEFTELKQMDPELHGLLKDMSQQELDNIVRIFRKNHKVVVVPRG